MKKNLFFVFFCIAIFASLISAVYALVFEPNISISPELDVSRFAPYKLVVTNIPDQGNISSLNANISVIGGDETNCWDYTVDGICQSS